MHLSKISFSLLLFVSFAQAQVRSESVSTREIFVVKDDQHDQWCGYRSKVESKSEAQRLNSTVVVGVKYDNGQIASIHVTEGDDSGDWNVDDQYLLDKKENLKTLSRVIDNSTLGVTQKEQFKIANGKAIRQSIVSRTSRTGERAEELSGDYLPEVPVVPNIQMFAFWPFIRAKQQEIWIKGKVCVATGSLSH